MSSWTGRASTTSPCTYFVKAFEAAPEESLLSQLEGVGVVGKVLAWIREEAEGGSQWE